MHASWTVRRLRDTVWVTCAPHAELYHAARLLRGALQPDRAETRQKMYPRRCNTSSVGQSAGLPIPRSSVRFRQKLKIPDNSNLHGFGVHRPSSKGTQLLFLVIKAIINQTVQAFESAHQTITASEGLLTCAPSATDAMIRIRNAKILAAATNKPAQPARSCSRLTKQMTLLSRRWKIWSMRLAVKEQEVRLPQSKTTRECRHRTSSHAHFADCELLCSPPNELSTGAHTAGSNFVRAPKCIAEQIAGAWARCPIPATEYAAAGYRAHHEDDQYRIHHASTCHCVCESCPSHIH